MRVYYHRNFSKAFKARITHNPSLVRQFEERLELFLKDPTNPLLKDHALRGSKSDYRAFSITGDIRVIYERVEDGISLYNIGTHNQVY